MWACLNCEKDFNVPERSKKKVGGDYVVIAVCPYCRDENIIDEEEYDFDDFKEE